MPTRPSFAVDPTRNGPSAFIPNSIHADCAAQIYDFVPVVSLTDTSKLWLFCSVADANWFQRIARFTIPMADVDNDDGTNAVYDGRMLVSSSTPADWDYAVSIGAGTFSGIRIGCIVNDGGVLVMYYMCENSGKVGRATSSDGTTWVKDTTNNPLVTQTSGGRNDGADIGPPAVIKEGSLWTMVYMVRPPTAKYRYATSSDGITWTKGTYGSEDDIFDLPRAEWHQLIKLGTGDYALVVEAVITADTFGIYVGRADNAAGPYAVGIVPWFQKSGNSGDFDENNVATPCVYRLPEPYGSWKLFYCGSTASTGQPPFAAGIADVFTYNKDLTTSLLHHWKLNESSGNRAASVGGLTLTDHNSVLAAPISGWNGGKAAKFVAASSQYLSHADAVSLHFGDTDWTIVFWCSHPINDDVIIGKDTDSPANSRDFTIDRSSGAFRFYINGGATAIVQQGSVFSRSIVIARHDSTADLVMIRVDMQVYAAHTTGGIVPQTSTAEFRIGARQYSGFEGYFDGNVRLVSIWNRLLDPAEEDELWSRGAGLPVESYGPTPDQPIYLGIAPRQAVKRAALY